MISFSNLLVYLFANLFKLNKYSILEAINACFRQNPSRYSISVNRNAVVFVDVFPESFC